MAAKQKWRALVLFFCLGLIAACSQQTLRKSPVLEAIARSSDCKVSKGGQEVSFQYYSSKARNGITIGPNKLQYFENSKFDSDTDLKIIIHGWRTTTSEPWVKNIRNAYLDGGYNVIMVDWGTLATCTNYFQSLKRTKAIGEKVAELLQSLMFNGFVKAEKVHVIGHSLGGHVAGIAGYSVQIGRITGLDVARPGYELVLNNEEYLDASDADFVDVIHTAAGITGWVAPIGHADFYPNRGVVPQPGCNSFQGDLMNILKFWFAPEKQLHSVTMDTVSCSHSRAHVYFLESISQPTLFQAVQCPWDPILTFIKCDSISKPEVMGEHCSPRARGTFYLETNSHPPFAKQQNYY